MFLQCLTIILFINILHSMYYIVLHTYYIALQRLLGLRSQVGITNDNVRELIDPK